MHAMVRKPAAYLKAALLGGAMLVAGCNGGIDALVPKHERPLPYSVKQKLEAKGMTARSPILIRIFKEEDILEIWKPSRTGQYAKLDEYEICKWSGKLGPKFKEGDRQAPEGFYTVTPAQMNPNSAYHLSFNMGFPNTFDRAHDRTGTHLMIHGDCSSRGCYSMTDEQVEVIYSLAREAFKGGQRAFQIQAFPFRMTARNMAKHVDSPHFEFWKNLKEGYDHFEVTKRPPEVQVCGKQYIFNKKPTEAETKLDPRSACPALGMEKDLAVAFTERQMKDHKAFQSILKWQNKPLSYALATPEVLNGSLIQNSIVPKPAAPAAAKPAEPDSAAEEPDQAENAEATKPASASATDVETPVASQAQNPTQVVGLTTEEANSGSDAGSSAAPVGAEPSTPILPEAVPVPKPAER